MDAGRPPPSPNRQSIRRILFSTSRDRLFVPPIYWTHRHLELLGCQFAERDSPHLDASDSPDDGQDQAFRPSKLPGYPGSVADARRLELRSGSYGLGGLLSLPQHLFLLDSQSIPFRFAGSRVTTFSANLFTIRQDPYAPWAPWGTSLGGGYLPFLGHCLYTKVILERRSETSKMISMRHPTAHNRPVVNLSILKEKHLTPADPLRDPYLVAMLIGIAQAQRDWKGVQHGTAKATLLVTLKDKPERLFILAARISESLLRSFDCPDYEFDWPGAVTIETRAMDIQPYESFQARLLDAVWTDLSPPPLPGLLKRKRESAG